MSSFRFVKALSYLRLVDDGLTYCLSRKLNTRAGKNVSWNIESSRNKLRNAMTLLKNCDSEIKALKEKAVLLDKLKDNFRDISGVEK
jgi:hypothetical protein